MTAYELVAMSVALGALAVPIVTWAVLWLVRRDRIFVNVDPGEVPDNLDEAPTRFVAQGAQYWGEVRARKTPPPGVSPVLAGVVADGSAEGRDIAAMVLDLTTRGWLTLRRVGEADGTLPAQDWEIGRVRRELDATLDLNEVYFITNLAVGGGSTLLSQLRAPGDKRLGLVQLDLYREVVSRGWYPLSPKAPSDVPMAVLGIGGLLGIVVALIDVSGISVVSGLFIVACAYLTSLIVRGGTPRTALGTATRIQVLGFRKYLEESRGYQFSYTDAESTFQQYLPWAVVFGLESHWTEIFAELDVVADATGVDFARDPRWLIDSKVALPDTVPPLTENLAMPRRGAYSEQDVVATVLIDPTDVGASTAPVVMADAPEAAAAPDRLRHATSGVRDVAARVGAQLRSGLSAVRRAPAPVAAASAETDQDEDRTLRPGPATARPAAVLAQPLTSAATVEPVLSDTPTAVPAVRQWVPRPSSRPASLVPRPRPVRTVAEPVGPAAPAMPQRPSDPVAPATPPRRAPVTAAAWEPAPAQVLRAEAGSARVFGAEVAPAQVVEAEVAPAQVMETPAVPAEVGGAEAASVQVVAEASSAQVVRAEAAAAHLVRPDAVPVEPSAVRRPPAASAPAAGVRPRGEAVPAAPQSPDVLLTGWLDELDLAMAGDLDPSEPDSTEGGTVISGPQRFDVLLAEPLWPDVPLGDRATVS